MRVPLHAFIRTCKLTLQHTQFWLRAHSPMGAPLSACRSVGMAPLAHSCWPAGSCDAGACWLMGATTMRLALGASLARSVKDAALLVAR